MDTLKCVLVGDECVGKRSMLEAYINNVFPCEYKPTIYQEYTKTLVINEKSYDLSIFHTAGQESCNRIRPLYYPQTDVFLVCFSIGSPTSYGNIKDVWYPELLHHCPNVPKILVGTKIEQRNDEEIIAKLKKMKESPISQKDGIRLARDIKAVNYMECSASNRVGLHEIFEEVVRTAQSRPVLLQKSHKCLIN